MELTESRLRTIINEELSAVLSERCKSPETGKWEKCVVGKSIYSQTRGSKRYSSKFDGRGVYRGRKEDGSPKLSSKFGSQGKKSISGGRLHFATGEELDNPKFYCCDRYKKAYLKEQSEALHQWLKAQDGNKDNQLIEEDNCYEERRQARIQGIKDSLEFIRAYEESKKGKKD
jgi:hypothetical protein